MRRILLLITDLQIGGTPTVVRELAFRLTAAGGAHIEVACLAPWGPVADQLKQRGIEVTAINASGIISLPIVLWRLFRLIRSRQIDTVFSFLVHANLVAAAVSLFCRRVRFLQSIQTTQPFPKWHWTVQKAVSHAAERIVVPSKSVAEAAWDWSGVPEGKIEIIPNAIDVADFGSAAVYVGSALADASSQHEAVVENASAKADPTNEERAGTPAPPSIGFIGRLDPIKRIPDLLKAMTMLDSGIHLHVFGEGAERSSIEQMIRDFRLTDRVTLHGAVSEPRDALHRIDLLVLPSQAEGFGLVLIEAMAAGIPVVATNVPGIRDVVINGKTGLLVPVAAPEELASAITALVADSKRREMLTKNAKQDVANRFSWDVVLPQYQRLLNV
jgi:glycosyltransferase involved in cell wall biosynthesis